MEPAAERGPAGRSPGSEAALEVMLLLADADAGWCDYRSAVRVLDMTRRATGRLPLEYELKRVHWARLRDIRRQ